MGWSTSSVWLIAPLLLVVVYKILWILQNRVKRKGHPFPPGPTPLPFLGSALSINAQQMWLTFMKWQAQYGDIMYIRLFDTDAIILSSTSIASELLMKRAEIYSDRPSLTAVGASYYDFNFGLLPYGERWRSYRRIFHQTFRADAALRFRPMQLRMARQLILSMIGTPDEYPSHLFMFSASVGLSAAYDYRPSTRNDPMVSIIDNFLQVATPGLAPARALLVKTFPFLLQLPDWFPGSWIKRDVKESYAWRNKLTEVPYRYTEERMGSKKDIDASIISDQIIRMEQLDAVHPEYKTALKHVTATTLNAGAETTNSTLMVFILAMVENPHVWKRAQVEIDHIVGMDRLPEFDDRSSLPYTDAIIREVLRWRPVFPLGGLHTATRSDIYKGYYIPQGAVVVINMWAISHDNVRYPDADKFIPERFLDADGMLTDDDPGDFIFGFGRRICPGRYFADASLWSAVATMLATLDFNLAKDADGNDIKFKTTFTRGILERPDHFPCHLTPRSHVHEILDRVLSE